MTPPPRRTAERRAALAERHLPRRCSHAARRTRAIGGQGGAFLPRGGTRSAVPGQAGALVAVLRKENAGSRGWRRPEFHKTGRRYDSAHARQCRAAGLFLLVAARLLIRALGGGVVVVVESSPRKVSRPSPQVPVLLNVFVGLYGSAETCGGPGLPGLPWRALAGAFPR